MQACEEMGMGPPFPLFFSASGLNQGRRMYGCFAED